MFNNRIQSLRIVMLLAVLLSLSACSTAPMNRQEAADWYTKNASELTWVGYQGTDEDYHYFVGRMKDKWAFIRIRKGDLTVEDQRKFISTFRYPIYYYQVDPSRDYVKIEGTEPDQSDD